LFDIYNVSYFYFISFDLCKKQLKQKSVKVRKFKLIIMVIFII
jgi:hypothetical protein